jgi:hypothetical protein
MSDRGIAYRLPQGAQSPYLAARLATGRWEQVDQRIILSTGHISTGPELGEYYIDFVPSFPNYSEYRYGVFDERGVPLVRWGTDAHYNPITIAQYGFIVHALHRRGWCGEAFSTLQTLLSWYEDNKSSHEGHCVWRQQGPSPHYRLSPGFISGMAMGEIISFYLRMYELNGDATLLRTAESAYGFLRVPFEQGGVRRLDAAGNLWFEEYPTPEPSFVLNGFIYCLFGLYDLYRVTRRPDVGEDIDACLTTLRVNLPRYDVGYWSLYDQMYRELVSTYYQRNVHVPQLEVLFGLTGDPLFGAYAARWRRQLRLTTRVWAQVMMRIRPRIGRLRQGACASST